MTTHETDRSKKENEQSVCCHIVIDGRSITICLPRSAWARLFFAPNLPHTID